MSNVIKLAITKTVTKGNTKSREDVGTLDIYCPNLADFGLQVEPTGSKEDGTLQYSELSHQFLYNAVVAATKAQARNKLQSGTITLKPNNTIAATLTDLITPNENASTVLADRRALLEMFKGYLAELQRNENVKRLLLSFMEKPELVMLQPEEQRSKIKVYFEEFGTKVEASCNDWQLDYLTNLVAQCDAESVEF